MILIKAVILAGGMGTRLRPVTLGIPKPMARVLDSPLIEHNVRLLAQYGIRDIFVTLRYMPREVIQHLGDGSNFGVNIEYLVESQPLGTAGGVRRCFERSGGPLLVMGGDAATNIDLSEFINFHYASFASVSIAAVTGYEPHEYGSIVAGNDGRISRFVEKPSRQAVCGELINTGIYILSESILKTIPDGFCDFAKDVFPALLKKGQRLFAWKTDGYWMDVGSCKALMKANMDALDGRLCDFPSTNMEGVTVIMPSYISPEANIQPGARIGPYAVIGSGCAIGRNAEVTGSVLCGAKVGTGARVKGSLLCSGASVGADSVVGPDCVLGENSELGSGCHLGDGTILWPGRTVASGSRLSGVLSGGPRRFFIAFDGDGRVSGDAASLTCDLAFSLGRAAASLSSALLYSSDDDPDSHSIAACFAAGAVSGGARAVLCDSPCRATLAHSCYQYSTVGLFVENGAQAPILSFFGRDGYPLDRDGQRALEAADGAFYACKSGGTSTVMGTSRLHAACAARAAGQTSGVAVASFGPASKTLSDALGCGDIKSSRFSFLLSRDGTSLSVTDASGDSLTNDELICAMALQEVELGSGSIVLPERAPNAARALAASGGARIYLRGRDKLPPEVDDYTRDGIYLAARLSPMLEQYESAAMLRERLPVFHISETDFKIDCDSAALLRRAAASGYFGDCETHNGLSSGFGGGHVHMSHSGNSMLRIRAECATCEMAAELAADAVDKLKKLL